MAIQPVYESVRINKNKKAPSTKIKVECKTEIPSDTVGKVLNVSVFAGCPQVNVSEKKVEFTGRAVFNVIYQNSDGVLVKAENFQEYSGVIDCEEPVCGATFAVLTDKTDYDLGGTRLVLSAVLSAEPSLFCCEDVSLLTSDEGEILDKKESTFIKSHGVRQGVFPVEEEFELDYEIAEVLSQTAQAYVTVVQCGVGCVIIDGEAVVSALLLQNTEKSDIIKETKTLPFRVELEYEEAMPAFTAIAFCSEKSLKSDVSVDPEKGTSVVAISLALNFEAEAFSEESLSVVKDAFSITEKTETEKGECEFIKPEELRACKVKFVGRAGAEIPQDAVITAVGSETVDITEVSVEENGLKFTGIIGVKAYLKDGDGKFYSITLEAPFEERAECIVPGGGNVEIKAVVHDGNARIISLTEAEISVCAEITAVFSDTQKIDFIKNVKSVGEKTPCESAISVYIPTEGEELWSLSKRLNVSPETLISINGELHFPLTGKERVVIYRQK